MSVTQTSSRYRFSRASRLLKPSEFQTVFDARKAYRGQWLTAHRTIGRPVSAEAEELLQTVASDTVPSFSLSSGPSSSPNPNSSRLGLIVAKRLVPAAARRNLVKRVVREYFRTTREAFLPGDWIIRLHESPFPSAARIRKGAAVPTRLQVVTGLRSDLTQILKRVASQLRKEGSGHRA